MADLLAGAQIDTTKKSSYRAKLLGLASGVALFVALFLCFRLLQPHGPEPVPPISGAQNSDTILRGEYLARAADCVACHTSALGKPFSGGRSFATPFGVLYSTNITSDKQHGIGSWSDEEFLRAVRDGIGREGNLYPAMPYTSYTAMSRDDVLAIKTYLLSLDPVTKANPANKIGFPFNQRWGLKFWNLVFFSSRRFQTDEGESVEWNRGAYLTNALGHCGECHTPRNIGFAVSDARAFSGARIEGWLAPNLTSDHSSGLGGWNDEQLLTYLKTGHANDRSTASGPMAEVIEHSLQYLSDADLRSMVRYLRTVEAKPGDAGDLELSPETVSRSSSVLPEPGAITSDGGFRLFSGDCAGCHLWNGRGRQSNYADLVGTRSVNDPEGSSVVQVILDGSEITVDGQRVEMPGFRNKYSNDQVASLANYVLKHFGGKKGVVTSAGVAAQRDP